MRIAGIGDNVIDRYLNKGVMYPGGNAVNVAAHSAMLGADSAYIGVIGDDLGGSIIASSLRSLGVDLSQSVFTRGATTKTCDVNVYDGEREEVGYDTGSCWAHKVAITDSDVNYLHDFDAVLTSVNAKLQDYVFRFSELNCLVVYDFSVKDKYRTEDYFNLVCPYIDLGLFSCSNQTNDEVAELLRRAVSQGCSYAIATRGGEPPVFYDGVFSYEGVVDRVDALDTMGAGDSYLSAFVVSCLSGGWRKGVPLNKESIAKAFKRAAEYSAENCLRPGGFGFEHSISGMVAKA